MEPTLRQTAITLLLLSPWKLRSLPVRNTNPLLEQSKNSLRVSPMIIGIVVISVVILVYLGPNENLRSSSLPSISSGGSTYNGSNLSGTLARFADDAPQPMILI